MLVNARAAHLVDGEAAAHIVAAEMQVTDFPLVGRSSFALGRSLTCAPALGHRRGRLGSGVLRRKRSPGAPFSPSADKVESCMIRRVFFVPGLTMSNGEQPSGPIAGWSWDE